MVDRDLLATKLAELSDRVERVRSRCTATVDGLRHDRDALDLVAFNLMLAFQTCADIASHIVADAGWPPAKTLRENFERLGDHGVIRASVADTLGRAVGLRNVIAHGYAAIDASQVHHAATAGLSDLSAFAREVARWAADVSPPGENPAQ